MGIYFNLLLSKDFFYLECTIYRILIRLHYTFNFFVGTMDLILYVVGSKSFRPDIQKPRQMENAVRDI